jgi:hypothetical protein
MVNQPSADVATLTVHIREPIGGHGEPGFAPSECIPLDAFMMDCTEAMERRFGAPALHEIQASTSQFFCQAMHVETVTKKAAFDASVGIGFFYNGFGRPDDAEHFVEKERLKKVRDVTLKNGEPAVVHTFVGLAGCFLGSATSSAQKLYEVKAFVRFIGDNGATFNNWELGDNLAFRGTNGHADRSAHLLR